jgi:hypothetical protein
MKTPQPATVACLIAFALSLQVRGFNNDDGITDLVWHDTSTGATLNWVMNKVGLEANNASINQQQTLPSRAPCSPTSCWKIAATGDFDRNGYADLVWRDDVSGTNEIWLMNGPFYMSTAPLYSLPSGWTIVGTGDFDGDGHIDLLLRNHSQNWTAVWYMNGSSYTWGEAINYYPDATWFLVGVGDFNRDGHPDLLWQNAAIQSLAVWYMNDRTWIGSAELDMYPDSAGWTVSATGSFNDVGDCDLVWRHTSLDLNGIWRMQNWHYLRSIGLPQTGSSNWQLGGTGGYITLGPSGDSHRGVLSAVANGSQLTLSWLPAYANPLPAIYRRTVGSTDWGTPLEPAYRPNRYTNTVTPGVRYEYKVGEEYILAASGADPVHSRGKVILVVESNIAGAIANELAILKEDLIGDGWTVVRLADVPRHDDSTWSANVNNINNLKSALYNVWNSDRANTKAAILIGHVPIPHSGAANLSPDGHGSRSLPADTYYADMDGAWTEGTVGRPCGIFEICPCESPSLRHENHPADGIWDHNRVPSALELAVGRIDFARLDDYIAVLGTNYETILLQRYLQKDHAYRNKGFTLQDRVLTWDGVGAGAVAPNAALRIGSCLFGNLPETVTDGDSLFPQNGCTWAIHTGIGTGSSVYGSNYIIHATVDILPTYRTFIAPGTEPHGGFYCLCGSCFLDYAYNNDLMRALIGAHTSYNLGAMWFSAIANSGSTPPRFDGVGLGEIVGSGFVRTVNESPIESANTYLGWMGDPTLRLQILAPPSSVNATRVNSSSVRLAWSPSAGSTQYFIYRTTGTTIENAWGPPITTQATQENPYTDANAPVGVTYIYQVRAVKLTPTGSGSFNNLSQGAFSNSVQ